MVKESFCQKAGNSSWCICLAWPDNRRGRMVRLDVNGRGKRTGMGVAQVAVGWWKGAAAIRHASDAIWYIYLSLEVSKGGVLCEKM